MDKKLQKFNHHEMNKHMLQLKQLLTTQYNINIPYNWLVFLVVNNVYTSLYVLIRIHYTKGHICSNVYNIVLD